MNMPDICRCSAIYTAVKISIEHVTIIPSKYISKGAVDMKFSPDVETTQVIHTSKTKQISSEIKLCAIKWNDREKVLNY